MIGGASASRLLSTAKTVIQDMMLAFSAKYPDKGYLIVVDEFLSYLSSRNEREIVLDLEFFRALGEMCSKSKLRVIFGMQEKIFDNPRFSFVADTLKHVSDRFTQLIITKEATSHVVSERILKKTPEQKALIRKHLEKFCGLYIGMSSRLEEFVDLFPIHPSYIDVFNKIYLIENRHILKNISVTIKVFKCPHCGSKLEKKDCEHAFDTYYDHLLGEAVSVAKQAPVKICYFEGGSRYSKIPQQSDFDLLKEIETLEFSHWIPVVRMPEGRRRLFVKNSG